VKHLISCREAVQQLWRFLDRELDTAERRRVDDHLEYCIHCCGELEFVHELRTLLASQRTHDLPSDVRGRLEHFVDHLGDLTEEPT
jgi:anti-sigma factor (TIGR02949 family)